MNRSMRSIPRTLLWELLAHGWHVISMFFLLGNTFPILVFTALQGEGLDPAEQACLIVHCCFLPIMMLLFGVGIMAAQGPLSRLYTSPVSTTHLVAWHLCSGAALMALQVFLSLELQRSLFYEELSVLGPSLFAAAAWASAQMLISVPQRTVFRFLQSVTPCMLMFLWLQSRFGGWFFQPTHYWTEVRLSELLLMTAATAASFQLTCFAVAKDRCGELDRTSLLRSLWTRIVNTLNANPAPQVPFPTPIAAQRWYEWRYRGVALPLGTALTLCIAGGVLFIRFMQQGDLQLHLKLLLEGLVAGGAVFALLAALAGMLAGSTSTGSPIRHHNPALSDVASSGDFDQMGHFPATRPLSDRSLADCILWNVGRSVLTAWTLWMTILLFVLFASKLMNEPPEFPLTFSNWAWYLPLSLSGAWVAMTLTTLMTLSGRCVWFFAALIIGVVLLAGIDLTSRFLLPANVRTVLFQTLSLSLAALIVFGTLLFFHQAQRRQLLHPRTARRLLFAAVSAVLLITWLIPPELPRPVYALIPVFSSLIILPFAAAPLAIAWNRHR